MWKVWLQRKIKYYWIYLTLHSKKPYSWIWSTFGGDAQVKYSPSKFTDLIKTCTFFYYTVTLSHLNMRLTIFM